MKNKAYKEYVEREFQISVIKRKGKDHTDQMFYGTKLELAIGVASMMEQLMENHVLTASELEELLEMAKAKRERNYNNDKQRRIYRNNRQTKGNRRYKNASK